MCVSVCISVSGCLRVCVSLCLSLSLCASPCHSVPLCASPCTSLSSPLSLIRCVGRKRTSAHLACMHQPERLLKVLLHNLVAEPQLGLHGKTKRGGESSKERGGGERRGEEGRGGERRKREHSAKDSMVVKHTREVESRRMASRVRAVMCVSSTFCSTKSHKQPMNTVATIQANVSKQQQRQRKQRA